eukprot:353069-Chlamydomonas_euryale.AAC.13
MDGGKGGTHVWGSRRDACMHALRQEGRDRGKKCVYMEEWGSNVEGQVHVLMHGCKEGVWKDGGGVCMNCMGEEEHDRMQLCVERAGGDGSETARHGCDASANVPIFWMAVHVQQLKHIPELPVPYQGRVTRQEVKWLFLAHEAACQIQNVQMCSQHGSRRSAQRCSNLACKGRSRKHVKVKRTPEQPLAHWGHMSH